MNKNAIILLLIISFALLLRLCLLLLNISYNPSFFYQDIASIKQGINSGEKPYLNDFGFEASNVAYAMVCRGEGFSSPFGGSTGPTGWVAPGMVFLYALPFYLFGCFTFGSILFMFLVSLTLSAAITYMVYKVCLLVFNDHSTAFLSSAFFAACPQDAALFFQHRHLDFNVYTFLLLLLLWIFIQHALCKSMKTLILFSLAAGLSFLFNPAFALPVIMCLAWLVLRQRKYFSAIKPTVTAFLIIAIIISPYVIFERYRLGFWSFIKSNSQFELYIGNVAAADGVLTLELFTRYHPNRNQQEFLTYKSQGEKQYLNSKFNHFLDTFRIQDFARLSFKRFLHYFFIYSPVRNEAQGIGLFFRYAASALTGLSLVAYLFARRYNKNPCDLFIYSFILSYALPYLFAGIMWRYSYPVVPLSIILLCRSIVLVRNMSSTRIQADTPC